MRLFPPAVASVLAVLLASPALAGWAVQGGAEPDAEDNPGFMFFEPDTSPDASVQRVYFNAIAISSAYVPISVYGGGGGLLANPVPGARMAPVGGIQVVGYLGIWKDCNGDGYIGAAASAMLEYPDELLSDRAICPPSSPHVTRGWVTELRWITPDPGRFSGAVGALYDDGAAVWADYGRPGDVARVECSHNPLPRGTLASSGGLLGYVDCSQGHAVARSVSIVDPDGSMGLAFEDPGHPERDCSSALNQDFRLHDNPYRCDDRPGRMQDADAPIATVWDCDEPAGTADPRYPTPIPVVPYPATPDLPDAATVDDIAEGTRPQPADTLQTGEGRVKHPLYRYGITVPTVALGPTDPDGSVYDTVEEALWGAYTCGSWPTPAGFLQAAKGSALEGAASHSSATDGKRNPDFPMAWMSADSSAVMDSALLVGRVPAEADAPARRELGGMTYHAGLHPVAALKGLGWRSTGTMHAAPAYKGALLRDDLSPSGTLYLTAYARVGSATLAVAQLPGAQPGVYGAEACGEHSTGLHGGWDCDKDNWWRADLGGATPPRGTYAAVPETTYQLRDIDCHDDSVAPGLAPLVLAGVSTGCAAP